MTPIYLKLAKSPIMNQTRFASILSIFMELKMKKSLKQ